MRHTVMGVVLGLMGVVAGYTVWGNIGVLLGAMLAPVSTLLLLVVLERPHLREFVVRMTDELQARSE